MKLMIVLSAMYESRNPPEPVAKEIIFNFMTNLDIEDRKGLEVFQCIRELREEKIPRGYDIYLVHHRDVNYKDLLKLRKEQPCSVISCTNNRFSVPESEQEAYDLFEPWFNAEKAKESIGLARRRR